MVHNALLFLRKVPKGRVVSYGELARACNNSPRAIGMIMKGNKDPVRYPCYKVIRSDGSVGGYIKGIDKKIKLLRDDGINIKNERIDDRYFYRFSV
ncbi:MAG: MGMT family protein [Candidatus Aenigmarchaeota archaeon]|nr:MGMT family protein [Candidatus Aenigmarchaeota archaeon]